MKPVAKVWRVPLSPPLVLLSETDEYVVVEKHRDLFADQFDRSNCHDRRELRDESLDGIRVQIGKEFSTSGQLGFGLFQLVGKVGVFGSDSLELVTSRIKFCAKLAVFLFQDGSLSHGIVDCFFKLV